MGCLLHPKFTILGNSNKVSFLAALFLARITTAASTESTWMEQPYCPGVEAFNIGCKSAPPMATKPQWPITMRDSNACLGAHYCSIIDFILVGTLGPGAVWPNLRSGTWDRKSVLLIHCSEQKLLSAQVNGGFCLFRPSRLYIDTVYTYRSDLHRSCSSLFIPYSPIPTTVTRLSCVGILSLFLLLLLGKDCGCLVPG